MATAAITKKDMVTAAALAGGQLGVALDILAYMISPPSSVSLLGCFAVIVFMALAGMFGRMSLLHS